MRSKYVLNRQKDFDAVYKLGKNAGAKYVVLFYRKNVGAQICLSLIRGPQITHAKG